MDRRLATAQSVIEGVPRLWPGETVVCLASGPSLTDADVAYVRGKARVVAVSDNYRKAPWADALYSHDARWWEAHQGVQSFTGLKYAGERVCREWGVTSLRIGTEQGLSADPCVLNHGKNSGYQAIGLSVHFGAAKIVLLGYDMQAADDGREHWFGSHPKHVRKGLPLQSFIRNFGTLVQPLRSLGVEIINCSRRTALPWFPQMPIEEALP